MECVVWKSGTCLCYYIMWNMRFAHVPHNIINILSGEAARAPRRESAKARRIRHVLCTEGLENGPKNSRISRRNHLARNRRRTEACPGASQKQRKRVGLAQRPR